MKGNPKDKDGNSAVSKIKRHVELMPQMLGDFENANPDWRVGILVSLLDRSLQSLVGYIEKGDEAEISWEDPFVELQFPVEVSVTTDDEIPSFNVTTGTLTAKGVATPELAADSMSRLMIRHLELTALQELTGHAALIKQGDGFLPALPTDIGEALSAIVGDDAKNQALRRILQPCSFGGGTIDYGDLDIESEVEKPVPETALEQIGEILEPLLFVPVTVEGHSLRVITIFEVNPLEVDLETRSGTFRIVVGLALQYDGDDPPEDWIDQPWASIAKWPADELKEVMRVLNELAEDAVRQYCAKDQPELEEVIVSVNALLKVTVPKGASRSNSELLHFVTNALAPVGEITTLSVGFDQSGAPEIHEGIQREWKRLLIEVDAATSAKAKGDALEGLMVSLFSSVPGFSIVQNVRTETEEIDLVIENNATEPPFCRESSLILVECKNWQSKAGKDEYVLLRQKAENRRGRCEVAFLVSWNGVAKTVGQEMLRSSTDRLLVVCLDGRMIRAAIEQGDFLELLRSSLRKSLTT